MFRPPFSSEEFFAVFSAYNESIWPFQVLLVGAAISLNIGWILITARQAAVKGGVPRATVVDGREPHAVLRKPGRLVLIDGSGHELGEQRARCRAGQQLVLAGARAVIVAGPRSVVEVGLGARGGRGRPHLAQPGTRDRHQIRQREPGGKGKQRPDRQPVPLHPLERAERHHPEVAVEEQHRCVAEATGGRTVRPRASKAYRVACERRRAMYRVITVIALLVGIPPGVRAQDSLTLADVYRLVEQQNPMLRAALAGECLHVLGVLRVQGQRPLAIVCPNCSASGTLE